MSCCRESASPETEQMFRRMMNMLVGLRDRSKVGIGTTDTRASVRMSGGRQHNRSAYVRCCASVRKPE